MIRVAAAAGDVALIFIELGAAIIGLAVLARLANGFGVSAIPMYLMGRLAFGNGGLVPLRFSEEFVHIGAEIGVILLLFMLGLEYTGEELVAILRSGLPSGLADLALNFAPGFLAGFVFGWGTLASVLLGGVTYISSSGIIAKVLGDLRWQGNLETPAVLSVVVRCRQEMRRLQPILAVADRDEQDYSRQVALLNALAIGAKRKMQHRQMTEMPGLGGTEPDLLAPAPHYTLWRFDKSFAVACARRLASARE